MTIKEFRNLKGNEILMFTCNAFDSPSMRVYRIAEIMRIHRDEPKYTVRQFLLMNEKEIAELKAWEPEVIDGYIKLRDYDTAACVHPVIRQPTMYKARYGYSYKCLKIVNE